MMITTMSGRVSKPPKLTIGGPNGDRLKFSVWARPVGHSDLVLVTCVVRGKRSKKLAEFLDDDVFVTCIGGVHPLATDKGLLHLYMTVWKVELQGFRVEGEMDAGE